MGKIVIDDYPLRRWFELGTTELPNYRVLKAYLVEKYKVCYFCGVAVKLHEHIDGELTPDNAATIDHLNPRPYRKRHELSLKVLACFRCNNDRNRIAQSPTNISKKGQ